MRLARLGSSVLRTLPIGGVLMALFIASTAHGVGGVGLLTTAKTLPPATIAVIDPESGTSSGGSAGTDVRVAAGDIILFRFRYFPVPQQQVQGVNAWLTEYVPPNLEVVGVRLMDDNDLTIPPNLPGLANPGYRNPANNWPNIADCTAGSTCDGSGGVNTGQGGLAQLYGDTGVFYSTDARTARDPSNALITLLNGRVYSDPDGIGGDSNLRAAMGVASPFRAHNDWDWAQAELFGAESGNTPHFYGSPVAGPDTYYRFEATENGGAVELQSAVGPWQRVRYPGSQIATGDVGVTGLDPARLVVDASTTGFDLTPNNPLPTGTNAVRIATGEVVGGRPFFVEVAFRVLATPLDPGFGATGGDINCGESFGGDISGTPGSSDGDNNMWSFFVPSPSCVFLNLLFDITADSVVGSNDDAFDDKQFTIQARNLSTNDRTNVWVRQKYNPSRVALDGTNPFPDVAPTCQVSNCDGDGFDCIYWSLGTLAPSDEITINTNFDISNGGDPTTPIRADFTSDDLGSRTGNPCSGGSINTPGYVTQELIQIRTLAIVDASLASETASASAGGTATVSGSVDLAGTQNGTVQEIELALPSGWSVTNEAGGTRRDIRWNGANVDGDSGTDATENPIFGVSDAMSPGDSSTIRFSVNVPAGTPAGLYPIDMGVLLSQSGYGADKQTYFNDIVLVAVGGERSEAPTLACPILSSWTSIPGTTTEANNTVIRVYYNGILRAQGTASSGVFDLSDDPSANPWAGAGGSFGTLYGGLEVRATAQAPGENESPLSAACFVIQVSQCQDGIDNDMDGLIDFPEDPGCASPTDGDESDPACSDGVDNDGDGDVDWPADRECDGPDEDDEGGPPACSDGVDNDGDGQTDFPNDSDCTSAADRTEITLRACNDGVNNDGAEDGLIDFPADPGCHSANDDDEGDFVYDPDDIRARLLFVFDTSGSMNLNTCTDDFTGGDGSFECAGNDVACAVCGTDGCGDGIANDSRIFQARAGLTDVIQGFGEVEYGLMRFEQRAAEFDCPSQNASDGSGGWQGGGAAPCGGFNGGDLLVGFSPENEYDMLEWMDNQSNYPGSSQPPASVDYELRGSGTTPIAGSLDDALAYIQAADAADGVAVPGCRPYRVVLITDGEETCGGDPAASAGTLQAAGVTADRPEGYETYVIGFATDEPTLDDIAAAGGTTAAIRATDATELSAAISAIVNDAILVETCNGFDDDCDGLVDEGFQLYCDVLNGTTVPTPGICTPPAETVCDGVDDNCNGDIDEGLTNACGTCGVILDDNCDGFDDDCDGNTDEDGPVAGVPPTICGSCIPSPEVCDGGDNDCDGIVDEDASRACGSCEPGTQQCVPVGGNTCSGDGDCMGGTTCLSSGGMDLCLVAPGGFAMPATGTFGACLANDDGLPVRDPQPETCNNVDDDCDGVIDQIPRICPEGTDEGVCELGTQLCVMGVWQVDGGGAAVCTGAITPTVEICNDLDEDCDGVLNNGNPGGGADCGGGLVNVAPAICRPGVRTCNATGSYDCVGSIGPEAETCDGEDDDCDGRVDEGLRGSCAADGSGCCGTCGEGVMDCVGGAMVCVDDRTPTTEACNNIDDDCDGPVDEGNPDGSTASCGGGSINTDPAICRRGDLVCDSGALVCQGGQGPEAETCDGEDDDCDGRVDEGVPSSSCVNPGDPGCCGSCGEGVMACVDGSMQCTGDRAPGTEVCNGLDDDCDGPVDEGAGDPPSPLGGDECGSDVGECDLGATACIGGALVCQGDTPPVTELCNLLDEDCDGITDEGNPGGGAACGDDGDVGECDLGTERCVDGAIVCLGASGPSAERCDGLDNDCDGMTDEGDPGSGAACGDDTGECMAGTLRCVDGVLVCQGAVDPVPEICDSLDNDCDGVVDDGLDVGAPCGTDTGECVPGIQLCMDGAIVCDGAIGPTDETCNILDDDCDGNVDEELALGGECGETEGACVPGMLQCIGGREVCAGEVPSGPEVCDCEDNDCDGIVDEDPDAGSLCPGTSVCLDCSCALPCVDSEFGRCPPGRTAEETDDGCFCVAPRCNPETCGESTVEVGGEVLCAPDASGLPSCTCTMGRCTFPCEGVVCSDPLVCEPSSGECVEDNCRGLGCADEQICDVTVPECVDDPCDSAGCAATEVCRAGACEPSCATVACDVGEVCVAGVCSDDPCADISCDAGEVCSPDGTCVPDACDGVMCPDGSVCEPVGGACEVDPCTFVRCPDMQRCEAGECVLEVVPMEDAGMPPMQDAGPPVEEDGGPVVEMDAGTPEPEDLEDRVLAAGGCSCRTAAPEGSPRAPWALIALALGLWIRRRTR